MKIFRITGKFIIITAITLLYLDSTALSSTADWVRGRIIVSGESSIETDNYGRPVELETGAVISISEAGARAFERAKDKAFSRAVSKLSELRVDADSVFSDLINADPVVRQRFSELLNSQAAYKKFILTI